MELKDTIEMMASNDYKERFKAEYWQLKIRIEKLETMLTKYLAGTLPFKPACSYGVLAQQLHEMQGYLVALGERALVEGIKLTKE